MRRRPRGAVRDGLVAAGLELARTGGPDAVELDDGELIEAVMGRLDETSGLSATIRALVSMMP